MRKILLVALAVCSSLILPGSTLAAALSGSSNTNASFNSNTNSTNYGNGNEAFFFRAKNANSPSPGFTNGAVQLADDADLVQALVNNDSGSGSQARNTVLTITLPSGSAAFQTATATVSADNASAVTDNVTFKDSQPFSLVFDQNAPVYIAERASLSSDYVNTATNNYRVNGNVMTVFMGDWAGGANQQGLVTVRLLVTRPSVQPAAFACSGLTRASIDNNRSTFTASANGTAASANISGYTFTVKDSSGKVIDTNTVSTSSQSGVYNFNQTGSGNYTVTAVANSDKGTTAVSSTCTQTVTVPAVLASSTTTPTITAAPAAAKALPNTGAGDALGIFSGASMLGGVGHYLSRRFRR